MSHRPLRLGAGAVLVAALALATVLFAAAPSGATVSQGLGSCGVFPQPPAGVKARPTAASIATEAAWNQDISKAPRDKHSAAYISYIDSNGGDMIHPDFGSEPEYGIPYSVVGSGQAKLPINYTAYGDESSKGPFPIPANARVEGAGEDGDRHVIAVDRDACKLYELFGAEYESSPQPHWNAESGVAWDLKSAKFRHAGWTSADAAGLPIFPGLVRYEEVAAGHLNHAIRVTMDSTRNAWVHPAVHCAGDTSNPAAPPMGLRLRLKRGYGLGHFHGAAKVIATAMKHYGLIVADNGSNWYISGSSDPRWNDDELEALKQIPGSAFEVVKSVAAIHHC
jgi:hypothetical protein